VRQFYDDARHVDRGGWVGASSVPTRRRSPVLLLAVLLLACLAPVGVVAATGLSGTVDDDSIETADGGDRDGAGDERDELLASGDGERRQTQDERGTTSSTAASTSTTASTATSAPPATAPTSTAPPATDPPATEPPATAPPATQPPALSTIEQVVALVNQARESHGCGPVRLDEQLTAAAQAHSDDMAANGYFSHTSLDGRTFDQRIRDAGYTGGYLAENIAQGQSSAQAVHDAWMSSPGHRRNILDCNYDDIGMGLHTGTWTWTQDFGGS
jgi:uncharacterized protein YkwD